MKKLIFKCGNKIITDVREIEVSKGYDGWCYVRGVNGDGEYVYLDKARKEIDKSVSVYNYIWEQITNSNKFIHVYDP